MKHTMEVFERIIQQMRRKLEDINKKNAKNEVWIHALKTDHRRHFYCTITTGEIPRKEKETLT